MRSVRYVRMKLTNSSSSPTTLYEAMDSLASQVVSAAAHKPGAAHQHAGGHASPRSRSRAEPTHLKVAEQAVPLLVWHLGERIIRVHPTVRAHAVGGESGHPRVQSECRGYEAWQRAALSCCCHSRHVNVQAGIRMGVTQLCDGLCQVLISDGSLHCTRG